MKSRRDQIAPNFESPPQKLGVDACPLNAHRGKEERPAPQETKIRPAIVAGRKYRTYIKKGIK
jgi:hypothetical protein